MSEYSARPSRYAMPAGDYIPPERPYMRPGSDHSHLRHSHEDQSAMPEAKAKPRSLEVLSPTDRRRLIIQRVDEVPRTAGQLKTELAADDAKTISNALYQLCKDGLVTYVTGYNNSRQYMTPRLLQERQAGATGTASSGEAGPGTDTGTADETTTASDRTCPDCKGEGEAPRSLAGACVPCPTCDATGVLPEAALSESTSGSPQPLQMAAGDRPGLVDDLSECPDHEVATDREKGISLSALGVAPNAFARGYARLAEEFGRENKTASPSDTHEPDDAGISRIAISHDGCLLLWIDGQMVEIDQPTTRGIERMLTINNALIRA